jgi:hypothetical protein
MLADILNSDMTAEFFMNGSVAVSKGIILVGEGKYTIVFSVENFPNKVVVATEESGKREVLEAIGIPTADVCFKELPDKGEFFKGLNGVQELFWAPQFSFPCFEDDDIVLEAEKAVMELFLKGEKKFNPKEVPAFSDKEIKNWANDRSLAKDVVTILKDFQKYVAIYTKYHKEDIWYLDIHSQNIFVWENEYKIADFCLIGEGEEYDEDEVPFPYWEDEEDDV